MRGSRCRHYARASSLLTRVRVLAPPELTGQDANAASAAAVDSLHCSASQRILTSRIRVCGHKLAAGATLHPLAQGRRRLDMLQSRSVFTLLC
jgi:hypothetical protein